MEGNNYFVRIRSQLCRQIWLQYLLTMMGATAGFFLLVFFSWMIAQSLVWQAEDPLYQLLHWVKENLLLVGLSVLLVLWGVITYFFIRRPLRYLDDMIYASKRLASPSETPIVLPQAMKPIEDEMNLIREQALRNRFLAREAEQRKNDLIVYLAHDLKTPLTSVIGYLTLLYDEPQISPALQSHYTEIALRKAERLEDLINEFFDITRFNLTAITLEPEQIHLGRMLEQILFEFDPILKEKGLWWEKRIDKEAEVFWDPDKMERVFDNLIRNAISYSYPNSAVSFVMETKNDRIEIRIQNRGKTIPKEKLCRIFEQFYRIDSSRSSKTGYAGLGLAIAKQIVELHGGTVDAESVDEAISFFLSIPKDCKKIV